jgi:hypothetical protein
VAFSKQANGLLIKAKRVIDSGDVLTPAEAKKGTARSSAGPAEKDETLGSDQTRTLGL